MNYPKIFLCRHGETKWSLSGQHTSFTDLPLTDKGRDQAVSLKKEMKSLSFEAIFCSPLQRAKTTCELAGFSQDRIILEPNAIEWNYGDYEGLTSEQILKKNPNWNLFEKGAPNGESIEEISQRADLLIQRFLTYKGNIILFSHGHFLRVLTSRWLNLSASYGKCFTLNVASFCILSFENKIRALELWNSPSIRLS